MLPIGLIMWNNNIAYHCYADYTEIHIALSPADYRLIDLLCQCIKQVKDWMWRNFLQLNIDETEMMDDKVSLHHETNRFEHITPVFESMHFLPVCQKIDLKKNTAAHL